MASKNTEFVLNSPKGLLKQFVSPVTGEWYKNLEYDDVKDLIRENFGKAAESFIAIGYYLKYVKEKELYKQDKYTNIWEFAQGEFNLTQGTASRYMSMNTRFSKDGNAPTLADDFKDFNKSQLQELLPMKEEDLKEALEEKNISPEMTVVEIRKEANKKNRELTEEEKREYDELTKKPEQISIFKSSEQKDLVNLYDSVNKTKELLNDNNIITASDRKMKNIDIKTLSNIHTEEVLSKGEGDTEGKSLDNVDKEDNHQKTMSEYLNQPIGNWKNRYHKAFDILKDIKYGHMVSIQAANTAFCGCPTDDFTDAIDIALLELYKHIN